MAAAGGSAGSGRCAGVPVTRIVGNFRPRTVGGDSGCQPALAGCWAGPDLWMLCVKVTALAGLSTKSRKGKVLGNLSRDAGGILRGLFSGPARRGHSPRGTSKASGKPRRGYLSNLGNLAAD